MNSNCKDYRGKGDFAGAIAGAIYKVCPIKLAVVAVVITFAFFVFFISTTSVIAVENSSINLSDSYTNNLKLSLSKIPSNADSGGNFDKIEVGLTDKSLYGIDYTDDYYLVVSVSSVDNKGTASYKYFGDIIFPITYPVTYPGVYTILLMGKFDNIIISSASYTIDSLSESNETLYALQNDTIQNDTVTINETADNLTIDYASNSSANITNTTNNTNTVNTTNNTNTVNTTNAINSLDSTQIICKDISLKIDKNKYSVRENVKITSEIINPIGLNSNLEIIENENLYQFVGLLGDINFIPTIPGDYKIVVKCLEKTGFIAFTVIDLPYQNVEPIIPYVPGGYTDNSVVQNDLTSVNQVPGKMNPKDRENLTRPIEGAYSLKQIKVKDSKGNEINKDIKLYRASLKNDGASRNIGSQLKLNNTGNDSSEIMQIVDVPQTIIVSEITDLSLDGIIGLNDASLRLESLELRDNDNTLFSIENVPLNSIDTTNIDSDQFKQVVSSYAMDLSNLNFTNGSFIKKATGSEVWKCREWNFAEQKCYGTWIKILDVIPGEYYSFEVSPLDPGYAETGLATINTDKGTYHINEPAKIISVVLDTNGYLIAGANVTLVVTNPNSVETVYSTESGTIVEESKGIYVANYTQTDIVGDYVLFVQAVDWGVNYSMVSSFNVLPFYEFDILRTIPGTIDPWKENLSVNITLISFNYTGLFSYSEKIPSNFTLLDFGGTIVSYYENYTLLTWNNLSNQSTISYSASVPLVSPNLYVIGPGSIDYGNLTYIESRPWYLAIDPFAITPGQVCNAQININGQDTYSSACDGTYPAACGAGAADRLTCNDAQSETHTGANNNRWAGVRLSSYNSSIVNCDSITAVQLCYEWWQSSGYDNARIGVDNDNWASVSTVSAVVPGTSANPGVTCTAVTANDNWVCGNFDGTGTAAQVVAQAQRDNAGGTTTLTIDVLYFNVTYNITVTAPTQSTPILNSTYFTNITNENLTCYNISTADVEGDSVKNIFNWYKNGVPFANLNMPFEGGSNSTYTRDYSGYGNNGTPVNVTYSSTGGYGGNGAYLFRGVDGSYINIPDSTSLSFTNPGITIAAWVYLNEDQTGERAIVRKDTQWQLGIFPATNSIRNLVGTSGTTGWTAGNDESFTINTNTWYFFAFTYNGSVLKHYVNGQQIGTDKIVTGNILDNANNAAIGANTNGITGGAAGPLNGTIDQVLILNVSLSAEQMLALYRNRTDVMLSQETTVGDLWMCQITPNDGIVNGITANSNTITILDTPNNLPNVTLVKPNAGYWNSTSNPVSIVFNCSITDDIRSQNISLYITNYLNASFAFNSSCNIPTMNGSCQWSVPLINGNYTWNCLGYDNKSQASWAVANRSIVINWTPVPPSVSNIQCYKTGVGWTSCSNIQFGNTLEVVRTTCTSGGTGDIKNASFILTNIQDNKIYFNVTTTENSTGYWQYNMSNLTIYDSGDFNLKVICRENPEGEGDFNWSIAWGTLSAYLVNPYADTSVTQYSFFNFVSNITCIGGECGYVQATLDPINFETADSGVVNDNDGNDEEGGSFTDTQSNNGVYYAIGENTNGANDNVDSQIDFTFNLSSLGMSPQDLNNLNVSITYCYSGANTYGVINCDGGADAPEKTPNGAQDIWMFNYNTSAWVDIGDLDTTGDETETTDIYQPAGNLEHYISSNNIVSVRVEYLTNNGNNNDAWFATDYVYLTVDYTILKSGAVSTVAGTLPFYTTNSNPQNNSDQSCLGNMSAGNTCTVTWAVNATGELGTVHEFFVLYNMTSNSNYVSDVSTNHINITIANNSAPYVNYVNLTPLAPGVSDNLNCSFVVSDSGPDTLSAIVYWYESDILQYNQTISVTNGIQASAILGSANTTAGDIWHCAVIPNDQTVNGLQVNSSKVNVSASNPPLVSNIECQRFGVVWGTCSNVAFNNIFSAVRATCTDSDGNITNASFTFSNQEDSYTYFSTNYSSSAGNVYTLDFFDITITDSGTFNIDVSCTDNSTVSAGTSFSWFIPWGTLSSTLISPNSSINVSQYSFFNFTSRVTCTGGECGEINATLDPIPSWWDGHYLYRMQLNLTNNEASTLQIGYSVNVSVNTSSNKFLSNGNDFRIVWLNGTTWKELDRINETTPFDSDNTVVWFKLQQSISASLSDGNYYVYYGYPGASDAPANRSKIYLYFDDFNRPDNSDITTEAAYHQTGGGTWSISGNKLVNVGAAGDPNKLEIDALGVVNYDVDMWTKINIYSTLGSTSDLWRMGLSSNMDDSGGDGRGYCLLFHEDHSSLDMLNDLRSWGTNGAYSWGVDEWYNMRFRVINPASNTGYGKIWTVGSAEPSAWTINAGNFGGGAVRGYGNVGFGGSRQGDTTYFDDIIIRYIVTNEPTVRNLSEEEYGIMKGIIPMNVGDPFYTITQNPMDFTTTNCLANMSSGDSCYTSWLVNATGAINSTWEFFVNYSSYNPNITDSISSKINITIIQNTPPVVSAISLNPSAPLYSDDLYCNFTIIDSFPLDILGVNVTWYLNGAFYSSSTKSVTSGVPNYVSLGSGNTSVGQVWKCGVRPYDQMATGIQVNSSNVTIILNSPPVITNIQCLESGLWTACSNLAFNDVLQGVRANCTSSALTVSNVTFNFSNIPDSQTYFFATNQTNVFNLWYHQQNVTMNNSGEFRVNILCTDNNSNTASSYVSWNLSWGTINISLINPNTNVFVEQNQFFNFSAQVECIGGECGQVVVTLDPLSGLSPSTGTADSGYVYDNPGNDEEGGSYIQTQTYNGPQTGVPGTTWYYIIGEGDTTNTALSYINLRYNISALDMMPEDIKELKFGLTYCHSGEDDVAQDFCDNDAAMEKTADGAQNVEVYDFTNDVWVDIGDITVNANEAMYNLNFTATGTLSNYVNRTSNEILVRYEADFSDTGGDGFLAIDYATLTVNFTKLKRGNVSTIPGTKPFYTINPNPQNYTTVACLANMIAGGGPCGFSWMVNATGDLNSTHEFNVIFDMFTNQVYVPDGESRYINITISDSSLIPPVVILGYPSNNFYSNNATINFNCSATDTEGLQNISLYANFSGVFIFNESKTLTGFSDSELFAKTLPEGKYLWNCIAYDLDDNFAWGSSNRTLTVDLTLPQINLTSPLAGVSLTNAEIPFNITASDNFDSLLNCSLTIDSVNVQQFNANNGQPTIVLKNVSEGIHYWNVTCADDAGNYNTSITRNFTISDFPPTVVLISANNTRQQSSSITLQYLPSDNNGIEIANLIINGSVYATNTSVTIDVLNSFAITIGEGYYSWTVNVSDVSNLTAQAPLRYFTIDNTAPTINLSTPVDNFSTNESSIRFNFTVFDNIDQSLTCNLTIDSVVTDLNFAASNGFMISRTVNGMVDGIHYWNVTCMDDTGNRGTSPTYMLNISNPPTVVLNSPADNFSFNYNNPTVYYTPTDNFNISNCTLILDNQINATDTTISNGVQNSFDLEELSEGYHNWTVTCLDMSGLLSNAPAKRTFLVDLHAPTISLYHPESTVYNGSTIFFNYTVIDNFDLLLSCNFTLDGAINKSGIISPNGTPVNFTVVVVNEGIHYWNITCIDDAGNTNVSMTRNFTNLVPPTVTLTSPPSGSLYNYSQNIEFVYQPYDAQGLTNTTLYLNGVFNASDNSPGNGAFNRFWVNFTNDGFYTWQVNVTDGVFTTGSSQIWNITIDTSPPVIGIINPIEDQVVSWNNVNFTFNVTDNFDSTLTCNVTVDDTLEIADVQVPSGSRNVSFKLLYDGNHNWSVTCADDNGWVSYSGLINFTVDAPPLVNLNFPTAEFRTKQRNITFNYTPQDAIGIQNCSLYINDIYNQSDSFVEQNIFNYFNVTNLADGKYNWTVQCIDEAPDLNSYRSPVQNFTVDNVGPVVILNYPPESQAINENDVTFNWTATDYAGTILTCNLTIDGVINQTGISNMSGANFLHYVAGLSDGPHTWLVQCSDDLGNPGSSGIGNFTINQPDLYITTTRIIFNNSNPNINETINITANVSNIGGVPANNVFVEFWDGIPGVGLYIGNSTGNVGTNTSNLFSTLWNITSGYHVIYVIVDPFNTVGELNESNNNATNNISLLLSRIDLPLNNSGFVNPNVTVNFTLQDFTGLAINYSVYVDNVYAGLSGNVTDNISSNVSVTVPQGRHSIKIEARDYLGRKKNSTEIFVTIDSVAPYPVINTANGTWFNYGTPTINISAIDNISINLSYIIYANGGLNLQGNITNGTFVLVNLSSLPNGTHYLIMEAKDEFNNTRNSTLKTIYVDTVEPQPYIETQNNTWFNTTNPLIIINITDNMAPTINYTAYIDGSYNSNGSVNNNTQVNITLSALTNGIHTLIIEGIDLAGNKRNSTMINIYVDTVKPSINLTYPGNNTNLTIASTYLNFTVIDNLATYLNCSITLDNSVISYLNVTNNTQANVSVSGLSGGYHNWNVTCIDMARNTNTSLTYRFFVVLPDIYVNTSFIFFTVASAIENDTTNITAEVRNIGQNNADNFTVEIRLGSSTGQLLGSYMMNLSINESKNVTVNYTLPIGNNIFHVLADVPLTTNGTVYEANESNNNASRSITVGSWQYVLGYDNGRLAVQDPAYSTMFDWIVQNTTGGNIFAADVDSNINWLNLTALSKNVSNQYVLNDFNDLDRVLGMENNSDSINTTYTLSGQPKETENITLFNKQVIDIPIFNSTNNSNFITGILWDSGDGGLQFNASQDVLFITKINMNASGYNGTYDFELRVPAKLRAYKGGTDAVALYAELK